MDGRLYLQFFEWEHIFTVTHYRGKIAFENSISYIIHSNEQGHNKPHLHAKYQEQEIVLETPTGKVLAGNLPPSKSRKATQWVIEHTKYIEEKWNELSNGIKIPVR